MLMSAGDLAPVINRVSKYVQSHVAAAEKCPFLIRGVISAQDQGISIPIRLQLELEIYSVTDHRFNKQLVISIRNIIIKGYCL